jgi:uncharacterized protein YcfJ
MLFSLGSGCYAQTTFHINPQELLMKRLMIASLFASTIVAAQAETYTDTARVRSAEPQYENTSLPRQECTSQWISEPDGRGNRERQGRPMSQERQYGGAILGGLAGGVVGHQFGGGNGKDAATALGVVLGAMAGDKMANHDHAGQYDNARYEPAQHAMQQREVQRCHTVYDAQTRLTGYRVAYDYRGQSYTTFMRSNPGSNLSVRVTVDPIQP